MARAPKSSASELSALASTPQLLESEAGERSLRNALTGNDPRLIAQAASLIAKAALGRYANELAGVYRTLTNERAHVDPGCFAKEALLTALEALDHSDSDLFAEAATYVQIERAKGGTRDTGARVRARGVLGLARLGHPDFMAMLGACLGDRDPMLRLAAAQSIAHRGQRDGAGLLLLRLHAGDEVPEIAIECLRGLFALAPDHALRYAEQALRGASELQREQTLQALGSASDDRAIELLATEFEQCTLASQRQLVIEALGLSRRSRARELLLSLVREGRASDAEAALSALAIHRYDNRLLEQLRDAAAHSPELTKRLRELMKG